MQRKPQGKKPAAESGTKKDKPQSGGATSTDSGVATVTVATGELSLQND